MLSNLASRLAEAAHRRGDRRRANFWTDVECWLLGFGTWKELRAATDRRLRQSQPHAEFEVEMGRG